MRLILSCFHILALTLIFVVSTATISHAQSQATDDIQKTIESQLFAFQADDAVTAYSFAAPNIQSIFPTPDRFMTMVKRGYQPVYRPQSYAFGEQRPLNGQMAQEVQLIGPQGDSWTALYTLQQQSNGDWKITGVQLVKSPGLSA